jgi:hypothetical protein
LIRESKEGTGVWKTFGIKAGKPENITVENGE